MTRFQLSMALAAAGAASLIAAGSLAQPKPSAASEAEAQACRNLTTLRLPDVRIVRGSPVTPDPVWQSPVSEDNPEAKGEVRAPFCRVEGVIEGEIGFELWLPTKAAWNGRFFGVGNGGFAGFFRYDGLARGVSEGFATASTDTGHRARETNWAIGHPRRLENLGHRGQHLTAVNAKQIVAHYYGKPAHHSYFMGCSGGGMQAMNEVQRYPADYDGIIAGAHGRSIIGISARWLASALYARNNPAGNLTAADWRRVADAAVAKCDVLDGVRDGIINSPRACRFDVGETPGLTRAQVAVAKALYAPILAKDGHILFPGFDPGVAYFPISEPGRPAEAFGHWLYGDPAWNSDRFDAARDIPAAEAAVPGASFTNPDLDAFFRRGGKLISHHGWTDQIVPAQATIDYFDSVTRYLGKPRTDASYRLYLAPGVDHCQGGAGTDRYGADFGPGAPGAGDASRDMLAAMVRWVEDGKAPGTLIASKTGERGEVLMTRPLCPYPQVSRYRGKGDPNKAESFTCVGEAPGPK